MFHALLLHPWARAGRRRAFSLVELSLVLSIIALLLAGIMLFYSSVQDRLKTASLLTEVSLIEGAINSLHSSQTNYDQVTSANIVAWQNWPTKWVSNGTLISPFYAPIQVTPWTYSPGDTSTDSAQVSLTSLNKTACISLVTTDFGYKVLGLLLNGANEPINGGLAPALAVTGCSAVNGNQVVLFMS